MSETTQNNEGSTSVNIEWSYSGKTMRAQALLYTLLSLLLLGIGIYATFVRHSQHQLLIWYGIIGCLVLLWGYYYTLYFYRVYTIRYRLTERHLYAYRGLFTRVSDSMELIHINDVRLVQTLFDRIFNGGVGKLIILCPQDKTDGELIVLGIDKPWELFEKIDSLRTALRTKRSILPSGS
jgi:uncharacterized membrane protein YdbT with pleckstrin-like domain